MSILLTAIVSYLLGSISSAILVSKVLGLPDPRVEGSRNPGATNVLRLSGKIPAALTLAGDVGKGTIPVLGAGILTDNTTAMAVAALAAFLGHLFPIYFKFRGGKGVATALGAYLGLSAPVFIGVGTVWLVLAIVFRYASLASIVAMLSAPAFAWYFFGDIWISAAATVIFAFVVVKHRTNIQRLLAGNENRIDLKKN